jgi:hypothetical protein
MEEECLVSLCHFLLLTGHLYMVRFLYNFYLQLILAAHSPALSRPCPNISSSFHCLTEFYSSSNKRILSV